MDTRGKAMDRKRGGGGFTLLEVVIALAILSVGILALAGLAGTAMKAAETGKRRTQALNLASEKLEWIKAIPYANLQTTGTDGGTSRTCADAVGTPPVFVCTPSATYETIDVMRYYWTYDVTYIDLDSDSTYYDVGTRIDSGDIKRIDLTVTWNDIYGPHSITLTTLRVI